MIYLIALLEGFSTLAVQIIALRAATPVVGGTIIMTSIYIGIILLALSIGYYGGGRLAEKLSKTWIIKWLFFCLTISGFYYLILTFGAHNYLLESILTQTGNYVLTLFLVALFLFFIPVTLASQTIPLLAELVPTESKGRSAGVMLFASTVGSFLWSVGTSIVLFQTIGVFSASILTAAIVLVAAGLTLRMIDQHKATVMLILVVCCTGLYFVLFHNPRGIYEYKFDSAYQEIAIKKVSINNEPGTLFMINKAFASAIVDSTKNSPFGYLQEAVSITKEAEPRSVLVLGSAGFTYPYEISSIRSIEQIDTVDIDPSLQRIAEEYFLKDDLPEKISVYTQPARYFLNQAITNNQRYDLILVDAYSGKSIPEQLLTIEFFESLNQVLTSNGIVLMNVITDTKLATNFSKNVATTMRRWLGSPVFFKNVMHNQSDEYPLGNILFANQKFDQTYTPLPDEGFVYTDNFRTTEIDYIELSKKEINNSNY